VIEKIFWAEFSRLSETLAWKLKVPACVGVPATAPAEERARPAGRLPDVSRQE